MDGVENEGLVERNDILKRREAESTKGETHEGDKQHDEESRPKGDHPKLTKAIRQRCMMSCVTSRKNTRIWQGKWEHLHRLTSYSVAWISL